MTISIDIETYSSVDLKKSGVYKYTEAEDFEILLIAVDYGKGSVCWDLTPFTDEKFQDDTDYFSAKYGGLEDFLDGFITDLQDPNITKTAHNAAFERTCLAAFFKIELPPEQWQCTMVKCSNLGLPMSLGAVAKVLGTEQKGAGTALINYFCKPCKPTKINGGRTRNYPHHAPARWAEFVEYCTQDVVAEKAIREKLEWFQIPDFEHELWCLDQRINDAGILMDMQLIHNALTINAEYRSKLVAEAIALTGLANPNSNAQLMSWLNEEQDEEVTTLRKGDVVNLIKGATDDTVKRVLTIRKELSRTSVKKYVAMVNCACKDNRARGLFQFYGASRTGRWAGRLVQMQNLTKWTFGEDLEVMQLARDMVLDNNLEDLELCFGNVIDVLSGLIRTAFIVPEGQHWIVADFSSIEARVIAWLANEKWRLDVFNTHGKIYEASAAAMFHVPIDAVTKDMRQRGKVAELALGYQGGAKALISMGALEKGIAEKDLPGIVTAWRKASPNIVQMWYDFQDCAVRAIEEGGEFSPCKGVKFFKKRGILFMQLPSGRCLSYMRAHTEDGMYGREVRFEGVLENTQWGIIKTYGGSLVENATQAIARDCLAYTMLNVAKAGHNIALHVHDEVGVPGTASLEELCNIMTQPAPWAKGLPLGADGFTSKFYKK